MRYSNYYLEQLESKRYRGRRRAIESALATLLQEPYQGRGGHRLRFSFLGLRSADIDKGDRVIYRICEECRKLGDGSNRPIDCCEGANVPSETVNILCLSDHYSGGIPFDFDFDD